MLGHQLQITALQAALLVGLARAQPAPAPSSGGTSSTTKILIGVLVGVLGFIVVKSVCLYYVCVWRRKHNKSKILEQKEASLYNSTGGKSYRSKDSAGLLEDGREAWEIDTSDVQICTREDGTLWIIGKGGFGEVYKGIRAGVQDVAIKMVFHTDQEAREKFETEIAMLKFVSRDRNIVQFYGAGVRMSDPHAQGKVEPRLWLITEYMEGGDLRKALRGDKGTRLDWWNGGKQVAIDIARGLAFLHANNVIHRDLKSMNILLAKDGTAKIGDVGMARMTSEGYLTTRDAATGTFAWAAPEMLLNDRCTEKVDVYSLGVVLWEIATGQMPMRGSILPPDKQQCPQAMSDIIQECMARNPEERPSAKDVFLRLKACEPCPETVTRGIMDSANQSEDDVKSNEQRLADLMRVLQNRYSSSDGQSYSGEFSTGWTSGALSRLDDTANLKSKVLNKGSPETIQPSEEFTNDSGYSSFEPEVISVSPNGDVVVQIDGVPERLPIDGRTLQQQAAGHRNPGAQAQGKHGTEDMV